MSKSRPAAQRERFHGRIRSETHRPCAHPGCRETGEFRAPRSRQPEADGHVWYCLEHVRAFNASYDYFKGMSREEIEMAGRWPRDEAASRRRFHRVFGSGEVPLDDPHGLFGRTAAGPAHAMPAAQRRALGTLGLDESASLQDIKQRYRELVRRYHPDANGGDRSAESRLKGVIDAYQQLVAAHGALRGAAVARDAGSR